MIKNIKISVLELKKIPYQFKEKVGKTIRIHFNTNGVLIISSPKNIKNESILKFVENNIDWIEKKYLIYLSKVVSYENDSYQYVFGNKCILKINISKTRRIDLIDNLLLISVNRLEQVKKDLIAWRYDKANIVFQEIFYKCFKNLSSYLKEFPELIIKTSKTKWGCCYYNENKIMLNVALTQVPLYLIEYVIYHELSHFVVHNHSKEFHEFLKRFVPNEKECFKELKKYNSIIQ